MCFSRPLVPESVLRRHVSADDVTRMPSHAQPEGQAAAEDLTWVTEVELDLANEEGLRPVHLAAQRGLTVSHHLQIALIVLRPKPQMTTDSCHESSKPLPLYDVQLMNRGDITGCGEQLGKQGGSGRERPGCRRQYSTALVSTITFCPLMDTGRQLRKAV